MKKITLLLMIACGISYAQQETFNVTFESGTDGSDPADWFVFQNGTNPALEIVANPDATGNTSATVAKFSALQAGNPWAGSANEDTRLGEWFLEAGNTTLTLMVYKTVISDVVIKFENAAGDDVMQLIQTNTVINEWETLTYDISGAIASPNNMHINRFVIFPDWLAGNVARPADNDVFIDNIQWTANRTAIAGETTYVPTIISLPLDFETTTVWGNFDGGELTTVANPFNNADNSSANVGQMIKSPGQPWGGSFLDLGDALDFDNNDTFTMKVYSPRADAKVILKMENSASNSIFFEDEITVGAANTWETLTFDYSAVDTSNEYSKMVLIFDNGTQGDGSADFTFFIDDITLFNAATASVKDNDLLQVSLYPSPANDFINISAQDNVENIAIYNTLGSVVENVSLKNKQSENINISHLTPGVYIVKYTINNTTGSTKFVKQ